MVMPVLLFNCLEGSMLKLIEILIKIRNVIKWYIS